MMDARVYLWLQIMCVPVVMKICKAIAPDAADERRYGTNGVLTNRRTKMAAWDRESYGSGMDLTG